MPSFGSWAFKQPGKDPLSARLSLSQNEKSFRLFPSNSFFSFFVYNSMSRSMISCMLSRFSETRKKKEKKGTPPRYNHLRKRERHVWKFKTTMTPSTRLTLLKERIRDVIDWRVYKPQPVPPAVPPFGGTYSRHNRLEERILHMSNALGTKQ